MIIIWKASSTECFTGEFNGHALEVSHTPKGWVAKCDGTVFGKPFRHVQAAKDYLEGYAQRVIMKLSRQNIQARQRVGLLPLAA